MNRVERIAAVLCREQSAGLCELTRACPLCDCGGASQGYARQQAAAVDAEVVAGLMAAAWQEGSVHGASHLANLQHQNPYRRSP
jgi:hypothetical protein